MNLVMWYIHSALQSFLTRPPKFAKIKDVLINSCVKKWLHITEFKDAWANGGPKIKLKGALSIERNKSLLKEIDRIYEIKLKKHWSLANNRIE